jgi:hypothetical protein
MPVDKDKADEKRKHSKVAGLTDDTQAMSEGFTRARHLKKQYLGVMDMSSFRAYLVPSLYLPVPR